MLSVGRVTRRAPNRKTGAYKKNKILCENPLARPYTRLFTAAVLREAEREGEGGRKGRKEGNKKEEN